MDQMSYEVGWAWRPLDDGRQRSPWAKYEVLRRNAIDGWQVVAQALSRAACVNFIRAAQAAQERG